MPNIYLCQKILLETDVSVSDVSVFKTKILRHFSLFIFMASFFVTAFMSPPCAAYAAVNSNDFQLIMRTIGFLQDPPKTEIDFVIVFDPQIPESQADAGQLKTFLGAQLKAKELTLNTKMLPVQDISKIGQYSLVFVTGGIPSYHDNIQSITSKTKSLSLSLDRGCVESRQCMIYLNSDGRVEIIMDKEAVDNAGYSFKSVFLMMVNMI